MRNPNPEIVTGPIRTRIAAVALVGSLAFAACGAEDEGYTFKTTDSASTTAEGTTLANPLEATGDAELILDGSDASIRDEMENGAFDCGGERNYDEWNVNFGPTLLLNERTELLSSIRSEFDTKTGSPQVLEALAGGLVSNLDANEELTNNADPMIRLMAAGRAHQPDADTVAKFPVYENYRCFDSNGDGVVDTTVKRDNRSMAKDGVPATLVGSPVTLDAWNDAIAIAYANGVDLTKTLIHDDTVMLEVNGEMTEVVVVYTANAICLNPIYAPKPPEDTTTTTVISTPPTLPPVIVVITTPKNDPNRTPAGVPGQNGGSGTGAPNTPTGEGTGPSGQPVNPDGSVGVEVLPTAPATTTTTTEAPAALPPATTGVDNGPTQSTVVIDGTNNTTPVGTTAVDPGGL